MSLRALLSSLKEFGFSFERHGSRHDIYSNGRVQVAVPRNKTININTAKRILVEAKKSFSVEMELE